MIESEARVSSALEPVGVRESLIWLRIGKVGSEDGEVSSCKASARAVARRVLRSVTASLCEIRDCRAERVAGFFSKGGIGSG